MSHLNSVPSRKLKFVDPVAFTPHFAWKKATSRIVEQVFCEGVSLASVAEEFSTPTYLYSGAAISNAYRELEEGLRGVGHTICFAVKSNGNLSILKRLAELGSGFDIVSGGELRLLQHIGVPGNRIVFSGVGKSRDEIREALNYLAVFWTGGDPPQRPFARRAVSICRGVFSGRTIPQAVGVRSRPSRRRAQGWARRS